MEITRISPVSGKRNIRSIPVTRGQYSNWQNGKPIQDAMPNVSREDREFILTGITPEEWKILWPNPDEAQFHGETISYPEIKDE